MHLLSIFAKITKDMDVYGWLLIFILGLKHGLAADHIAAIDGLGMHLTRQGKQRIVPWLGTLFALGHGIVITLVICITGFSAKMLKISRYWIKWTEWLPVLLLFLIAFLNLRILTTQKPVAHHHVPGLSKQDQYAINSFSTLLIGACFAMFFDTLADAASWGYSAASSGSYVAALFVGLVFTLGMLVTDTIDSRLLAIVIRQSAFNDTILKQRRMLTWIVVISSFAIGIQELLSRFFTVFRVSVTEDMIIGGLLLAAVVKVYIGIYTSVSNTKSVKQ